MSDRKVILSTLWIFAALNYVYADVFNLYFNPVLQTEVSKQLAAGYIGSTRITPGFVLGFAVLIETAIAMVILSRILPYTVNRWANISVAVLQTVAVAFSFLPATPTLFYAFFAIVEIACTLFVVWYGWTWPKPEREKGLFDQPG